jgi:hypothetical protein
MAFGAHTPLQLPLTQAWFEHAVEFCHVPVPSQVCGCWPMHCLAPGLHVPEHCPPAHTLVQTVPFVQAPLASHVCGVSPLHCFALGAHTPVQAPPTHAWFVHAEVDPHWPLVVHV